MRVLMMLAAAVLLTGCVLDQRGTEWKKPGAMFLDVSAAELQCARQAFEIGPGPDLILGGLLDREVTSRSTVLGATSGDTGSAAIEACRGRANLRIVVLYPDGLISDFQRRQMTTVGDDNVLAVAVKGNFDDCQAMVKAAFSRHDGLLAFNSINWARVAAQTGYYVSLAARFDQPIDVVVPTLSAAVNARPAMMCPRIASK